MNRVTSIDEIALGDVLWAYARNYWRQVRVVAKARRVVTVAYTIRATSTASASLKRQDLSLSKNRLRLDRPPGRAGVLDVPAPSTECGFAAF